MQSVHLSSKKPFSTKVRAVWVSEKHAYVHCEDWQDFMVCFCVSSVEQTTKWFNLALTTHENLKMMNFIRKGSKGKRKTHTMLPSDRSNELNHVRLSLSALMKHNDTAILCWKIDSVDGIVSICSRRCSLVIFYFYSNNIKMHLIRCAQRISPQQPIIHIHFILAKTITTLHSFLA